ncbi:MAG: porin [Rubrivivax sp.]|jgi:predicted porin
MKKSMLALAALTAFAGAASAQSSVTIWGIVDATYAIGNGSLSDKTQVTNSGYNSSRLGFRGVEDMGGGSRAGFWLEAGVNNDNGSMGTTNTNNQSTGSSGGGGMTFNRRSTVSWGGEWGEVRLGRDYTPHFWNHTVYDPFGTNGVGTSQIQNSAIGGSTQVRASNSIGYLYGMAFNGNSLGPGKGFHAFAQMYRGENNSGSATSNDGNGFSFRLGYDAGPLSVAFANGSTKYASGKITSTNLGASYNLGVAKLSTEWAKDKVAGGKSGTGALFGANIPLGTNEVRVAVSNYKTKLASGASDGRANKLALGYVQNLSKRTALYATYARVSNSGTSAQALNGATTAAGGSSTGMDFGIRHSF